MISLLVFKRLQDCFVKDRMGRKKDTKGVNWRFNKCSKIVHESGNNSCLAKTYLSPNNSILFYFSFFKSTHNEI
jgi:hypothetical protein